MDPGPRADPDGLSPLSVAQLRAVCAVADRPSSTSAAHELGLTQPAVSRLVTGAERRLGLTLFHRVRRSVTPRADTADVLRAIRSALWRRGDHSPALRRFLAAAHDLASARPGS